MVRGNHHHLQGLVNEVLDREFSGYMTGGTPPGSVEVERKKSD
jgi:hypothetical protein